MDSVRQLAAPSVLRGERRLPSTIGQEDCARAGCTGFGQRQDNGRFCRTGLEAWMNGDASTERGAGTGPVSDLASGPATVPAVTGEGQLWALLQDLVAREGRDAAAVRLGLSERTIRRTLTDRRLSRRMTEALLKERNRRRAAQRAGSEPEQQQQLEEGVEAGTGPVEELTARVGVLETEFRDRSGCLDEAMDLVELQLRSLAGQLGLSLRSEVGVRWERRLPPRAFPALVVVEPAPDDAQNYLEALPLVAEWRRTLAELEEPPHTLAWLRLQQRLLVVEVELIDDHRLTLPPAEVPWDTVWRGDELRLRRRELADLRRQRVWTEVLHGLARIATLGLWGRAPSLERQLRQELRARQAALVGGPETQAERGREDDPSSGAER